jgi:putative hemolysin
MRQHSAQYGPAHRCGDLPPDSDGVSLYAGITRRAAPSISARRICESEDALDAHVYTAIPPLIKGYLRLGAWICAEPAWDQSFNTVDLLIVMPAARIDRRYFRRYLRDL